MLTGRLFERGSKRRRPPCDEEGDAIHLDPERADEPLVEDAWLKARCDVHEMEDDDEPEVWTPTKDST